MKLAKHLRYEPALSKAMTHNQKFHDDRAIARPIPDHDYGSLDLWYYDVICLACDESNEPDANGDDR